MSSLPTRRRAVALVIVIATLAVLALLAVSFARMMRIERSSAAVERDAVRARLDAEAGIEFALARLRQESSRGNLASLFAEGALDPAGPMKPVDLFGTTVTGLTGYPSAEALEAAGLDPASAPLFGPPGAEGWDSFRIAILDNQSRIDLNQEARSLPRILDNLGRAIDEEAPPIREGEGAAIVAYRDTLPGGRYASLEDLLAIPGGIVDGRDLAHLRPYVTLDSWTDRKVVRPPDASARPAPGVEYEEPWRPSALEIEGRSPINVNTAAKPVLVAVLAGLEGRREVRVRGPSLYWRYGRERSAYVQRATTAIDLPTARRVADRIIAERATRRGGFRTWSEFDAFVDALVVSRARDQFRDLRSAWITVSDRGCALTLAGPAGMTTLTFSPARLPERDGWSVVEATATGRSMGLSVERSSGGLFWYGPVSLVVRMPEGSYRLRTAGGSIVAGSPDAFGLGFDVEGVEFRSDPESAPLELDQPPVLKANFNPNTRLVKFNPDAARRFEMDKSDIVVGSTEFCFDPMDSVEVAALGIVHDRDGAILAHHAIRATIEFQEIRRDTTQADFSLGEASGGMVTYPQPDLDDLPRACREDGHLALSTCETPAHPGELFHASWRGTLEADRTGPGGNPHLIPDRRGPTARSLLDPAPGSLHPDGLWARSGKTPFYQAAGNMAPYTGTIAFWIKPDGPFDRGEMHIYFEATDPMQEGADNTQQFQVGAVAKWGDRNGLGFGYEVNHSEHDGETERGVQSAVLPQAASWVLVVASYDFLQSRGMESIDIVADEFTSTPRWWCYSDWQQRRWWPGSPEAVTGNGRSFSLGGRPGARIFGYNPADATFGEVCLYEGFRPAEIAERLYRVGRYYNGGDAVFTSAVIDPGGARRVARIAWTGVVPPEIPGGRIRARVAAGGVWGPWLDDPGGSAVDLVVAGPVRYQVAFEETAEEWKEPLLSTHSLDDVTVYFLTAIRFSRWETAISTEELLSEIELPEEANEPEPPLPPEDGDDYLPGAPPEDDPSGGIPPDVRDRLGKPMVGWAPGLGIIDGPPAPPSEADAPPVPLAGGFDAPGSPQGGPAQGAGRGDADQASARGGAGEPGRPVKVQVVVVAVDDATGKPIRRPSFEVSLGGEVLFGGPVEGSSSGNLVFPAERGKTYVVVARARRYASAEISIAVPEDEREDLEEVDVRLARGGG